MVANQRVRPIRFRNADLDERLGEEIHPRVANIENTSIRQIDAERLKRPPLEPFVKRFALHVLASTEEVFGCDLTNYYHGLGKPVQDWLVAAAHSRRSDFPSGARDAKLFHPVAQGIREQSQDPGRTPRAPNGRGRRHRGWWATGFGGRHE